MRKIYLFVAFFLALCLPLLAEAGGEPGMPVEIQTVSQQLLKENLPAIGKVNASQDIKVASLFSGRIVHLNARLGSYVNQNEVIASIRTKEAEALLGSSDRAIKEIKVRAPITGYLVENYLFPGEIAAAGQPLVRLISSQKSYLSLDLPGAYLSKVKKGTLLTIKAKGREYVTSIDAVIPVIDPTTGTFRALAPIKARDLYPGVVCQVILYVSEKTAPAIARSAILSQEGEQIVFVVSGNKVEKRVVETGIRTDALIEITRGVKVGESVAIVGNYELADGMTVRVTNR